MLENSDLVNCTVSVSSKTISNKESKDPAILGRKGWFSKDNEVMTIEILKRVWYKLKEYVGENDPRFFFSGIKLHIREYLSRQFDII